MPKPEEQFSFQLEPGTELYVEGKDWETLKTPKTIRTKEFISDGSMMTGKTSNNEYFKAVGDLGC